MTKSNLDTLNQLQSAEVIFGESLESLDELPSPLRGPYSPPETLHKFKAAVTEVIDMEFIRESIDALIPTDLPGALLRRFWLGEADKLTSWDCQLLQNQLIDAFSFELELIVTSSDNKISANTNGESNEDKSLYDALYNATHAQIRDAVVTSTLDLDKQELHDHAKDWFGYWLTSLHKCEPNVIHQLRIALYLVKQHCERKFRVCALNKNYEVYGAWRLRKGSRPCFELVELLNRDIGYENLHLHKIADENQLQKTASLLKHFRKMVLRAGGKQLLLPNGSEMAEFCRRPYVKDILTPDMFIH
ncbi:hypothetical protein [Aestuariibacter salexigens]|uniref:hypothetical protein n=1 Tax=Aestuariibacter salexigens TaxID=226010 RepID=UPI0004273754|nr:hypothetical protein [Aestuariibacter salexigens]